MAESPEGAFWEWSPPTAALPSPGACGSNAETGVTPVADRTASEEETMQGRLPSELVSIPAEYRSAAGNQGTLENLFYDTCESFRNGSCGLWSGSAAESTAFTLDSTVGDVVSDPAFGDFGRLLFPVDRTVRESSTLRQISDSGTYVWYSAINPERTVQVVNHLRSESLGGRQVFYPIYSADEIALDPWKADTGLFFFRGEPGARFAMVSAGGGFSYVAAMHDSFPHALELSRRGYNAFALIYRPGAQTACEDLARAIEFVFQHAAELQVGTDCYSLWGGSAGARMSAWLGSYGAGAFGASDLPQAGTVVMQYTGLTEWQPTDPPTYVCVGTNDYIANGEVMRARVDAMSAVGIPTEFHAYRGLSHGFGLGEGTVAEGWIDDAVSFWEAQMEG